MTQLVPDWHETWTAEQFEKELDIKFNGPGLYLSPGDTIVVFLVLNQEPFWRQSPVNCNKFEVNVYNCRLEDTILYQAAHIPTRMDDR